jgi:hypothetical protein
MSDDRATRTAEPRPPEREPEPEWERRRRLAAVFGEVLPETTQDEREPAAPADDDPQDHWLRSQVPPHHG